MVEYRLANMNGVIESGIKNIRTARKKAYVYGHENDHVHGNARGCWVEANRNDGEGWVRVGELSYNPNVWFVPKKGCTILDDRTAYQLHPDGNITPL